MPPAPVRPHVLRPQPLLAHQPVDERGLARTRQPQQRHGAVAPDVRVERLETVAGGGADRKHIGAERYRLRLEHEPLRVLAEVGLGEQDHRLRAALPAERQVPLQPAQAEPLVERVDQEYDVDVGRHDLPDRLLAGGLPREAGAPLHQRPQDGVVAARDGRTHRRPVAHRRCLEPRRNHRPVHGLRGEHRADAAVDAGDAPGHGARLAQPRELLVPGLIPAQQLQTLRFGRPVVGPPGNVTHVDISPG
jgi:hypothetical protein